MYTVFAHFFIFTNGFTQSGLKNEQFIEPHAFLAVNDLASHPTLSSVSKIYPRDIRRLRKRETKEKYFKRRSAAYS
jgi:hypothetical protein